MRNFDFPIAGCKVFSTLSSSIESRDDDRVLLSIIWTKEIQDLGDKSQGFFKDFLDGNLTTPESLTRSRRKIQNKHVELRGETYEERHKMEAAICQQLTFFDMW